MNEQIESQNSLNVTSKLKSSASQKLTQVKFLLEPEIYQEMNGALTSLSTESDVKITMAKFLRRIVLENWKPQLERFRKLHVTPKRTNI
jgi:hypothetical protein